MALNDIYTRGMDGSTGVGFYDPLSGTWSGNNYITFGGGGGTTTPAPAPPPAPKGNDIRFKLLNGSNVVDTKLSFDIQSQKYSQNSLVELNMINESQN